MELDEKKVEVELRGTINKKKFDKLTKELRGKYAHKKNYKKTFFYITHGFILKIEIKKELEKAILIVKNGDETKGILEEIEINFNLSELSQIITILKALGFLQVNIVKQKREDYYLEENIVFSLKYTKDWGYHFEIEKVVSIDSSEETKVKLADKCNFLGVKFMTMAEIAKKIKEINKKHSFT